MSHSIDTLFAATLAIVSLQPAVAAEEAIHGRIHGSEARGLRVCFDRDFTPGRDQEFSVLRHTTQVNPKGQSLVTRSAYVGVVRVAVPGVDHCADATLVSGHAQALDWVAMAAS